VIIKRGEKIPISATGEGALEAVRGGGAVLIEGNELIRGRKREPRS